MIKGAQKRMIVIKTSDSSIFEEAYFVMRNEKASSNEDMVSEANRIIAGCGAKKREKRSFVGVSLLIPLCTFIAGSILGSLITFGVMLLGG